MTTTTPSRRARWGTISRDRVVATATRLLRESGYEELTIRRIASDLGVSPMSLYRHVRDKTDLLDEVVDRMLARRWRPRVGTGDWAAWLTEAAERFRSFLVAQPAALHVYLERPVVAPTATLRMETALGVLRDAGFSDLDAHRAYAAVHTYTIGFAALEASRARSRARGDADARRRKLARFTTSAQFSAGLGFLVAGIGENAPIHSPRRARRGVR